MFGRRKAQRKLEAFLAARREAATPIDRYAPEHDDSGAGWGILDRAESRLLTTRELLALPLDVLLNDKH